MHTFRPSICLDLPTPSEAAQRSTEIIRPAIRHSGGYVRSQMGMQACE